MNSLPPYSAHAVNASDACLAALPSNETYVFWNVPDACYNCTGGCMNAW
jgi:hypothetical protein